MGQGAVERLSTHKPPYSDRLRRVAELSDSHPHAAELLTLYAALIELQQPIFEWTLDSRWCKARNVEGASSIDLATLPFERLERRFRLFSGALRAIGTEEIAESAEAVLSASGVQREMLLSETASRHDLAGLAKSLSSEGALLAFHSRAFLQPVAEALAVGWPLPAEAGSAAQCPFCAWSPQVGILRDEPETKGRRLLVCSLCAIEWPAARIECPNCGESNSTKLLVHEDAERPHLRIDECQSCSSYLKTVDLRRDGRGVPLVDDLASIELDLWAGDKGLSKVCPNLLGY